MALLPRRPFHKFTEADKEVWRILYERQFPNVSEHMSQPYWLEPMSDLGINADMPDFEQLSRKFQEKVGWELYSTEEIFSSGQTWFEHLAQKQFLISEYIRDKESLDYTPLPDIFHDGFGHLPLMGVQRYADLIHRWSFIQLECDPVIRQGLGSVWWYAVEFGMIEEDGKIKGLGAGLASSRGELQHALSGAVKLRPFDTDYIRTIKPSPHEYHKELFVLESFEQLEDFLDTWVKEGKGQQKTPA